VSLVNLSAMPDVQDEYQELVLVDLVDDSVVTGPHSPFARAADQPRRGWRTRILGEELLAVKIAPVLPVIAAAIDRGQISATAARHGSWWTRTARGS